MMKKQMKFAGVFLMFLLLMLVVKPMKLNAATSISLSDLPPFPANGQKCWVIFKEGFRGSRVELTTCNLSGNADKAWIKWDRNLTLQGTVSAGVYNQYYLNDSGKWEQIGTYGRFTDYATSVIASNIDVKDSNGRICITKSRQNGYPSVIPVKYKITYIANGGSGAPASQKFTSGYNVKISFDKPTRNGYSFQGWSENPKATNASYYSGNRYKFNKNVTLYAIWKKNIPIYADDKNLTSMEKSVRKSAVSFANIFAKKARSAQGTTSPNAEQQLKKLGNELLITGNRESVPDEVVEAFAMVVLNTISDSNIDKYETDQKKLTEQIYRQIKKGIKSGSRQIILGKKKTTYTVNYTIYAHSVDGFGAQVSWADVKWKDVKNKPCSVHIVSNSTNENMEKALASYCAALAQLNKGIWKEFMVK